MEGPVKDAAWYADQIKFVENELHDAKLRKEQPHASPRYGYIKTLKRDLKKLRKEQKALTLATMQAQIDQLRADLQAHLSPPPLGKHELDAASCDAAADSLDIDAEVAENNGEHDEFLRLRAASRKLREMRDAWRPGHNYPE